MNSGTAVHVARGRLRRSRWSVVARVEPLVAALAYWLAVGLPIVYLSLLASGIDSTAELSLFLGLFTLHLLALVGGRNHEPGAGWLASAADDWGG